MSALADELLADLEGLSEGEEEYKDEEPEQQAEAGPSNGLKRKAPADEDDEMSEGDEEEGDGDQKKAVGSLVLDGGIKPAEELDADEVQRMELGNVEDVRKVAKLYGSKRMNDTVKVIMYLSLVAHVLIQFTGNRQIPGEPKHSGTNVTTCTFQPGIQSHCPGEQLVCRCGQ